MITPPVKRAAPPAVPLEPLEIVYGLAFGQEASIPALPRRRDQHPRAALEAVAREALSRPPCLVSFSGGVDSSALLALTVSVARREGLDDPIPATLVFPSAKATDELTWQDELLTQLGLDDRLRFELHDELDAVGPVAQRALRRHGLLWPFNLHFHLPIIEAAAGGSVVTGFGGDELGRASYSRWAERMVVRRELRHPRQLAYVLYHLAPMPVKRAREYVRGQSALDELPYFTGRARRRLRGRLAAESATPFGLGRLLRDHLWRSRYFRVCRDNFQALAEPDGVRMFHPFVEASVLQALPEGGRFAGYNDRGRMLEQLLGDLLPRRVLERRDKAGFTDPLWTETAYRFAREWSGRGLDDRLVEPELVRRAWLRRDGPVLATTMLQAAWLADHGGDAVAAPTDR